MINSRIQKEFDDLFYRAFQMERNTVEVTFEIDKNLEWESVAESEAGRIAFRGQDKNKLICGMYSFFESLGMQFLITGIIFCRDEKWKEIPKRSIKENAGIRNRGIRMHLNFVQDQSFFSKEDFENFIIRMSRMKMNYLLFHMYNSQEWFPFSYRGEKHLELELGNLGRKPLPQNMIGREKIKTKNIWYPRELEDITDTEALLEAVHKRYLTMMELAKEYGIRLAASFEPEVVSDHFEEKLKEWAEDGEKVKKYNLTADWQEGWSGKKLADVSTRNPILLDMAVERALSLYEAYPLIDELHFISREGTSFQAETPEEYLTELHRLEYSFGIHFSEDYIEELWKKNEDTGIVNAKAYPYWTVLPGQAYIGAVIGAFRYLEFVREILKDERLIKLQKEKNLAYVISLYSPNPTVIRLFNRYAADLIPEGVRFDILGDYGARDISRQMEDWKILIEKGNETGMISWLEFDGNMALAQGWMRAIYDNVKKAAELGIETVYFNHWRLHSLEQNAELAAKTCYGPERTYEEYMGGFVDKLFGQENHTLGMLAFEVLEEVTDWCKNHHYNIGFTNDWVYWHSTDVPGYKWQDLEKAIRLYKTGEEYFRRIAENGVHAGSGYAAYMADMCRISQYHLEAVLHLQKSKLPLVGYSCFPVEQEGNWPDPQTLKDCVHEANMALQYTYAYMKRYAGLVTESDEQGQLAHHQLGMVEALERHLNILTERYEASVRQAIGEEV